MTLDHISGDGPPGIIRKVLKSETHLIEEHLMRLDNDARRRRFAHDVGDRFIHDYACHAADFGNATFGYFVDGDIRAIAELRKGRTALEQTAEVAFSVERPYAGKGIATKLMGRVIHAARNRGVRHLMLVCLAENVKMRAIAAHYGADLTIADGSVIADIVPMSPDYQSFARELMADRMAYVHAVFDLQARLAKIA